MLGTHQVDNAAAAVRAAELALGARLSADLVSEALLGALNPGRFEIFPGTPLLVLDAMHTPDAAQRFCESVAKMPLPASRALVFAALSDKRLAELAEHLTALAGTVYVAPVANGRSADPEQVERVFLERGVVVRRAASIGEAIASAKQSVGPLGVVFVVGGVYTVAEARAHLV